MMDNVSWYCSLMQIVSYFLKLIEPNCEIIFDESAYPANSEGITFDSSTAVHGLHIQSAGARVTNCKRWCIINTWIFLIIKYYILIFENMNIFCQNSRRTFLINCLQSYFAITFRYLGWSAEAFGQKSWTVASRSPLSWQHIHERSVCHSFDPETWMINKYICLVIAKSTWKIQVQT